jgi:hypothetical protein
MCIADYILEGKVSGDFFHQNPLMQGSDFDLYVYSAKELFRVLLPQ